MQNPRTVALYPASLRLHLPAHHGGDAFAPIDDLAALPEETALLAALYLPQDAPQTLPPLYALSPALWQDPRFPLAGRADQGQRGVAARIVETLVALGAQGPLPPSPRGLRLRALHDSLGRSLLAVAGGGKVGRALGAELRRAKLRTALLSDHAPAAEGAEPWTSAGALLSRAEVVVWTTDRPLSPHLPLLRAGSALIVAGHTAEGDLAALLASLDRRRATAITLYRPLELPRHPRLVALSDSPRRQDQAMAQLLRHLAGRRRAPGGNP